MHNQDMNLVLSTDAKPRLKWTPELHHRFIDAVAHLGGADSEPFSSTFIFIPIICQASDVLLHSVFAEATPKTLMRVMGVPGLTLYHLKSHLQAFFVHNLRRLY